MQKANEDCFYFLTSTCAKGPACLYRHNPAALTCNTICSAWLRGSCLDPNCNLRHSNVQSQTITNGITCFYENTPKGCLKLDCTYMHTRPRFNMKNSPILRPSTTNLVNKPTLSLAVESTPVTTPPVIETPTVKPKEPTPPPPVQVKPKDPTPPPPPPLCPPVQVKPKEPTPPPVKPVEKVPSNNQPKSPIRNMINNNASNETKVPSRLVVNRSVVVAESNRKVVQNTSNRVVVSSQKTKKITNDSDSDLEDLDTHDSDTKKNNTVIDITFPCSAPRLFVPSKPTTPTNDTKPIRLNRNRLPAVTNSTSTTGVTPSKEEQTSAGTGLLSKNEEERRINRLERFKTKPNSPPRSVVSATTRNVINSSPNDRKRPATDPISQNSPPSKRLSSEQQNNNNNNHHHHQKSATIGELCSPHSSPRRSNTRRRRRSSSVSTSASSSSSSRSPSPPPVIKRSTSRPSFTPSMNESAWNRQVDEFLAKTSQPKPTYVPKPMPLLSVRPRYTPPSVPQQSIASRPRPRQPTSHPNNKRPFVPVSIPSKPVERPVTPPPPSTPAAPEPTPIQRPVIVRDEEEDRLLESDEPTDVVDTFALIDEVLLEADNLLELM